MIGMRKNKIKIFHYSELIILSLEITEKINKWISKISARMLHIKAICKKSIEFLSANKRLQEYNMLKDVL